MPSSTWLSPPIQPAAVECLKIFLVRFTSARQAGETSQGLMDSKISWLPIVDAFRTFCFRPGSQGKALIAQIQQLAPALGVPDATADEL